MNDFNYRTLMRTTRTRWKTKTAILAKTSTLKPVETTAATQITAATAKLHFHQWKHIIFQTFEIEFCFRIFWRCARWCVNIKARHTNIQKWYVSADPIYAFSENGSKIIFCKMCFPRKLTCCFSDASNVCLLIMPKPSVYMKVDNKFWDWTWHKLFDDGIFMKWRI